MIPGFYIAGHPWLRPIGVYKVGFTRDLRRRLHDSGYILCFSPEDWKYVATFETETGDEAERIESFVKEYYRDARPWGNELVKDTADNIVSIASQLVSALAIQATKNLSPRYPRPPARLPSRGVETNLSIRAELATIAPFIRSSPLLPVPPAVKGVACPEIDSFQEELRPYQNDAVLNCVNDLNGASRSILHMACRCGKTKVAYEVIQTYLASNKKVLFLVPGLALLRQTAQKLVSYGLTSPLLLVGSDPLPVRLGSTRAPVSMTTDWKIIGDFTAMEGEALVVSTYQSSAVPADTFDLIVFDEAHRVCGDMTERVFNYVLLNHTKSHHLFMTATPRYDGEISMNQRERFGGVAYRYHLREGINAGYVNNFRLELVVAPGGENGPFGSDDCLAWQIKTSIETQGIQKMLIFCKNISHINSLSEKVKNISKHSETKFVCYSAHSGMSSKIRSRIIDQFSDTTTPALMFNCRLFQEGVEFPDLNAIFFAAPRHSPIDIIQSLCRPLNKKESKPPSVIFIPLPYDQTSYFDSTPNLRRYSTIVPFIDALLAEDPDFYDHLLGVGKPYPFGCFPVLGKYALEKKINQQDILDAVKRVVRYGPGSRRGFDRLLSPCRIPWERGFRELARIVRQCGRYPKTVDAVEISSGVIIPFHRWYRWTVKAYLSGKNLQLHTSLGTILSPPSIDLVAGFCGFDPNPTVFLEPYQINQLESLEGWPLFGVKGPYPWDECMKFLETWLDDHDGMAPMVEINRGGYVCLEATWMERLSGALTCVNQGDGRARKGGLPGSGFTISEQKQDDLDRICTRFGLRWRKERDSQGELLVTAQGKYIGRPSFIQTAHKKFKRRFRAVGKTDPYFSTYFPGYHPQAIKYLYQERPDVYKKKLMPLKWRNVKPKK